jgi:hypothetical protein
MVIWALNPGGEPCRQCATASELSTVVVVQFECKDAEIVFVLAAKDVLQELYHIFVGT